MNVPSQLPALACPDASFLVSTQAEAGSQRLLRVPQALRILLLLWLFLQSGRGNAAICGGMTTIKSLHVAWQCLLPCLLCAARVPVVGNLQPETVWPLARWLGAGAGGVQPHASASTLSGVLACW